MYTQGLSLLVEEGEWENEEKKQEKKENLIKETPFSGDIHFN